MFLSQSSSTVTLARGDVAMMLKHLHQQGRLSPATARRTPAASGRPSCRARWPPFAVHQPDKDPAYRTGRSFTRGKMRSTSFIFFCIDARRACMNLSAGCLFTVKRETVDGLSGIIVMPVHDVIGLWLRGRGLRIPPALQRGEHAAQRFQGGGLARPVRADQGHDFARVDLQFGC